MNILKEICEDQNVHETKNSWDMNQNKLTAWYDYIYIYLYYMKIILYFIHRSINRAANMFDSYYVDMWFAYQYHVIDINSHRSPSYSYEDTYNIAWLGNFINTRSLGQNANVLYIFNILNKRDGTYLVFSGHYWKDEPNERISPFVGSADEFGPFERN